MKFLSLLFEMTQSGKNKQLASPNQLKKIILFIFNMKEAFLCFVAQQPYTRKLCRFVMHAVIRIILEKSYENYEDGLKKIDLESLEDRITNLCLKFASKNEKTKSMFPPREKSLQNACKK